MVAKLRWALKHTEKYTRAVDKLKEQVSHYIMAGNVIRHTLSAESTEPIRHSASAKLQQADKEYNKWINPATKNY